MDFTKADRNQIEAFNNSREEKNLIIEANFESERATIEAQVKKLYAKLYANTPDAFIELQADVGAMRAEIAETHAKYMTRYTKEKAKFKKIKAERFEYFTIGFGVKLGSADKGVMLDRDLASMRRGIELIETHLEYIRDIKDLCIQIGYAIKNNVDLMNIKLNTLL
jgi:hypothetical protein